MNQNIYLYEYNIYIDMECIYDVREKVYSMVIEIDWSCCKCSNVWRGPDGQCPKCQHIRNPLHKHEDENAKEYKTHKKTRERP